jgi:RND family efflux transporter MFP subunit
MKQGRIGVLVVALLVPAGFYLWQAEAATRTEVPRKTTLVERGTLHQTVLATGVVRPVVGAEINVGSRISGTVVRLPVRVGDHAEAGQVLAELEDSAQRATVDEARAELLLTRARVTLAESTLDRRQRLVAEGVISVEELDTAHRDLAVERARLAAGEARLRSAEIALGYTRITAPIRGVVAEVTTREGETVAAGFSAPTFVRLVDLHRLEVLAYVDETDIGRIALGQAATFTVDTYSDTEFTAVVTAIEPKAVQQGNVVNYVVRLDFEAREGCVLRPEMTAHVRLFIDEREEALTIARNALRRRDGRQYVVVERGGRWVEQEVKTGWRTEGTVEVLNGLEAGERLELNPN